MKLDRTEQPPEAGSERLRKVRLQFVQWFVVQMFERLASLGFMKVELRALLKPL